MGVTKVGKGTKVQLGCEGHGLPVSVVIAAAHVPETKLIEPSLDAIVVECGEPQHLLYDKAADSDALRERLADRGVELVTPHRHYRPPLQDGRALRRYKRRFKIEHLIARPKLFRRVRTRFDYLSTFYHGYVHLACCHILLNESF